MGVLSDLTSKIFFSVMTALICILFLLQHIRAWFYCLWPSKYGCRHHYYIVICDIDRSIIKYTFFDNGGINLHRNDTWDIFPACSWLTKLTIFYGVFTSSIHKIEVYFRGCTGNLANILNPTRLHVSALSRLKYGNNAYKYTFFCFKIFYAS